MHTHVSGRAHPAAARERSLYRRVRVVITALALGAIVSLVGTGVVLQIKSGGVESLLTPAFLTPMGVIAMCGLLYWLWISIVGTPFYQLSATGITMAYHFPASLFRRPLFMARERISKGRIFWRPGAPEIVLGDEDGNVIWIPLWLKHAPKVLTYCDALELSSQFHDELASLQGTFLSGSELAEAPAERREAFFGTWGLARLHITSLKQRGVLHSTPLEALYPSIRLAVDTVQLVYLLQIVKKRVPLTLQMAMDELRGYLLYAYQKEIPDAMKRIATGAESEDLRATAERWYRDSKHKKRVPPPLAGLASRLFSAGGHWVTISPDGSIETADGDTDLVHFPAFLVITGMAGIKEIQLIDAEARKMIFNRECDLQLRRIFLYAPHIGEVYVHYFSGFLFTGTLKKYCSQLEIQQERG